MNGYDAMLNAMVESGCTPRQIADAAMAALAAMQDGQQSRDDRNRAANRERQRRYRQKKEGVSQDVTPNNAVSRDVTLHNVTDRYITPPSPDKESPPTPPKEINPIPDTPLSPLKGAYPPTDFRDIEPDEVRVEPQSAQTTAIVRCTEPTESEADDDWKLPVTFNSNEEFAFWFEKYPHKVARGSAERAYKAARRKASFEVLVNGLRRYIENREPDCPWCNPANWLDGERWLDEPAPPPARRERSPPVSRPNPKTDLDRFEQELKEALHGQQRPLRNSDIPTISGVPRRAERDGGHSEFVSGESQILSVECG